MNWLWTWGGRCFGYREGSELWTYDGKHVGRFNGNNEVFGPDGRYLGEIINDRLIRNSAKSFWQSYAFTPYAQRMGFMPYMNYVGYVMYAGHEEFPRLEGQG